MEWVVEIETASPDGEVSIQSLQAMDRCLAAWGPQQADGVLDSDGWTLQIAVMADDLRAAWSFGMFRAFSAVFHYGLPSWPIIGVNVMHSEYAAAKSSPLATR